jgi:hypothetical protein
MTELKKNVSTFADFSDFGLSKEFEGTDKVSIKDVASNEKEKKPIIIHHFEIIEMNDNFKNKGKKTASKKKPDKKNVAIIKFSFMEAPTLMMRMYAGSAVIQEQLEKHKDKMPYTCTIWNVKKYMTLKGAK